jgi:hypothetical protein
MTTNTLESRPSIELEDAITQLHAMISASTQHLLSYIAEFDRREAWRRDGATSMIHWLCGRLNVSYATAKGWVDAAHALQELPAMTSAFGEGSLSWDQVRELVRFATPERDEELATQAPGWSAAEVKRRARNEAPLSNEDVEAAHRNRYFRMRWDERERMLQVWGRLSDTDGATVEKAFARMTESAPRTEFEQACADALVELASMRLGSDPDVDRATLVVHVDEETLSTGEGVGRLENGIPLHADTVRRLGCDGRVQLLVERNDGEPLGVGRASRKLPAWLLRHIKERDGGCRFPGCTNYRWLHAHHIRHWASGGPTDASNLVLLCSYHHRLVHDNGWKMDAKPDGALDFIRPDGSVFDARPPTLRPDIRERFLGPAP